MDEADLNTVLILPNIGRITVREALAKGLLEPPHQSNYGKSWEETDGVEEARERKEHLSKIHTGKELSSEHRLNISKGRTGIYTGHIPPSAFKVGHEVSDEVREKISKALTGTPSSLSGKTWEKIHGIERAKELKENLSEKMTGKELSTEHVEKLKMVWQNYPEIKKEEIRERFKKNNPMKIPENAEKVSKALIERWKDPEFAKIMWEAFDKKPNNSEIELDNILQQTCPGAFKYTGNGGLIIDGKCPDFTHVIKPKLIELYGDYWHEGDDPQERIAYFKKCGYDTLIIWEYELWDELEDVVKKVLGFIGD